jgi:subtilisin family serine protease
MSGLTWNLRGREPADIVIADADGVPVTPDWAWGQAGGAGARVCVIDSGIEPGHPLVEPIASAHVVIAGPGGPRVEPADPSDNYGHGTACASIIRRVAPECEIHSVRVLGDKGGGSGPVLAAGLRWAVERQFDVINLSLSTTRIQYSQLLREIADDAYFGRSVVVASAHNAALESFPWRFGVVISVGSHQEPDPDVVLCNPIPPVEFFAMGQRVPVAGLGGSTSYSTGNSFAAAFVTGRCALILGKHPTLMPFQVKDILYLTADNVRGKYVKHQP